MQFQQIPINDMYLGVNHNTLKVVVDNLLGTTQESHK